ncbi:MAG: DUF1449 family protein [Azospirillaceae bacterium]
MDFLFDGANAPFLGAALLLVLLAALEVGGQLVGLAPSGWLDDLLPGVDAPDIDAPDADLPDADIPDVDSPNVADAASGGIFATLLDWLNIGRVPALVVLIAFLGLFSAIGFGIQSALIELVDEPMPAWIAWFVVLIVALPPTRWVGAGIARVMPREETYAVAMRSLVGSAAVVTMGEVTRTRPGKAKVRGQRGNTLWVRVRAAKNDEQFRPGQPVILTAFADGVFDAAGVPDDLAPED